MISSGIGGEASRASVIYRRAQHPHVIIAQQVKTPISQQSEKLSLQKASLPSDYRHGY